MFVYLSRRTVLTQSLIENSVPATTIVIVNIDTEINGMMGVGTVIMIMIDDIDIITMMNIDEDRRVILIIIMGKVVTGIRAWRYRLEIIAIGTIHHMVPVLEVVAQVVGGNTMIAIGLHMDKVMIIITRTVMKNPIIVVVGENGVEVKIRIDERKVRYNIVVAAPDHQLAQYNYLMFNKCFALGSSQCASN
jgi:hypothetical protein